jgi:hypothetical protein
MNEFGMILKSVERGSFPSNYGKKIGRNFSYCSRA